jgi:biotin transport system substrate-specific component
LFAASPALPQGIGRLLGPTGGYLMAYPAAAFIAGRLAERGLDRRYFTAMFAMLCGLGVIFAGGVAWLALVIQPARGVFGALAAGFFPFILADLFKLLVAAGLTPSLWWIAGRSHRA